MPSDNFSSILTQAMENASASDFVLQKPQPDSRYYLKSQIFFFNSPSSIKIEIGCNELVRDVIKHIMTLYRKDKKLSASRPLEFPEQPERYQLFFIDDDETEYQPDYDMGPRSAEEPIGEFPALAFVLNKKFKGESGGGLDKSDLSNLQTEEEKARLAENDQRLLKIQCSTILVNKQKYTIALSNNDMVSAVISSANISPNSRSSVGCCESMKVSKLYGK